MKVERLIGIAVVAAAGVVPPTASAQGYGQRCFTPTFWCALPAPAPLGSNCYCATQYGPVYGRVG